MMKKTTKDFKLTKFIFDIFVDVIIVSLLVVLIRNFVFAPFRVHGQSMCDTFNNYDGECISGDGEFVLTSKFATYEVFGWQPGDVERGDVVIFQAPYSDDGEFFIKRIIGLPGDTILLENGLVYLMDESGEYIEMKEDYLSEDNAGSTFPHRTTKETYKVPEGEYFVLGDNRKKSSDSRRCFKQLGCDSNSSPFISHDSLEGQVKFVIYPFSHMRLVDDPEYSI